MINNSQLSIGKSILNERKKVIYEIYKMFGNYTDAKLRQIVLGENSPAGAINSIPDILSVYMMYSIKIPKHSMKEWFENEFLEYN